jgi:hypothetical protein
MIVDRQALSNPFYAEDVVNMLEQQIENLKFERRAADARALETSKVCSFMIEVVAKEAYVAGAIGLEQKGVEDLYESFAKWWGNRKVILDEGN